MKHTSLQQQSSVIEDALLGGMVAGKTGAIVGAMAGQSWTAPVNGKYFRLVYQIKDGTEMSVLNFQMQGLFSPKLDFIKALQEKIPNAYTFDGTEPQSL